MTHSLFRPLGLCLALALGLTAAPAVFAQPGNGGVLQPESTELPADHPDAVVDFGGPDLVILEGEDGPVEFMAEVAVTPRARQRGMMFREEMGANEAMLFFYDQPQIASIWMKNTLVPLDILFVKADGTIAKIARDAEPGSLASMRSGVQVAAVLEIPGGRAAELGVEPGSTLHHLSFGNMDGLAD